MNFSGCSNKRLLCIDFFNATPHIETSLEICLQFALKNGHVDYGFAGHLVQYNEGYIVEPRQTYPLSQSPYEERLAFAARKFCEARQLPVNFIDVSSINYCIPSHDTLIKSLTSSSDINELMNINSHGMRIGLGVASTLIWLTKDSNPTISSHGLLIESLGKSYLEAYYLILSLLAVSTYDYVLVFNGRFCLMRAIQDAALVSKVVPLFHERGADEHRFFFQNWMPHDRTSVSNQILSTWHDACKQNRKNALRAGQSFFTRRRCGDGVGWKSFTDLQVTGTVPLFMEKIRSISGSKPIICYFSSSDDEYKAVGDELFGEGPFGDQLTTLRLFYELSCLNKCHLIIRIHPHMAEKSVSEQSRWQTCLDVNRADVTIIDPTSNYSTYELMDSCDIVAVYGSTCGIEAVAAGKPVIHLGVSFYSDINVSMLCPRSLESLSLSIDNALRLKVDPKTALPYGYWLSEFGNKFRIFEPQGLFDGSFLGIRRSQRNTSLLTVLFARLFAFARKVSLVLKSFHKR